MARGRSRAQLPDEDLSLWLSEAARERRCTACLADMILGHPTGEDCGMMTDTDRGHWAADHLLELLEIGGAA